MSGPSWYREMRRKLDNAHMHALNLDAENRQLRISLLEATETIARQTGDLERMRRTVEGFRLAHMPDPMRAREEGRS